MIYFNSDKIAHTFLIENPLCVIEDSLWNEFQFLTLGKDYDIINGKFKDLRNSKFNKKERFESAKSNKYLENTNKANEYLKHTFVINVGKDKTPCHFIYDEKTERNLNSSALGFITEQYTEKQWTDEEGLTVFITAEDVATVLLTFNEFANAVWDKWGKYKQQIDEATKIEDIEKITIDFSMEEQQ